MAADVDIYDATLDDVDRLLIWDARTSSDPPPSAIETWIEDGALELQGALGDIPTTGDCGGDGPRGRARRIVALYAAATAEDAHYPERAADPQAGDYGARLWSRWEKLSTALVADLERCRDGVDPSGAVGGVAHSFPCPPLIRRCAGT